MPSPRDRINQLHQFEAVGGHTLALSDTQTAAVQDTRGGISISNIAVHGSQRGKRRKRISTNTKLGGLFNVSRSTATLNETVELSNTVWILDDHDCDDAVDIY